MIKTGLEVPKFLLKKFLDFVSERVEIELAPDLLINK